MKPPKPIKPSGPITTYTADPAMLERGYAMPTLGPDHRAILNTPKPDKNPESVRVINPTNPSLSPVPLPMDNAFAGARQSAAERPPPVSSGSIPPPLIAKPIPGQTQRPNNPLTGVPTPPTAIPTNAQALANRSLHLQHVRSRIAAITRAEDAAIEHARQMGRPLSKSDLYKVRQRASLLHDIDQRNPQAKGRRQALEHRKANEAQATGSPVEREVHKKQRFF